MKARLLLALVLLGAGLLWFLSKPTITANITMAQKSADSVLAELRGALDHPAAGLIATGARVCVVLELEDGTYYFDILKTAEFFESAVRYCADPGQDNLIIKFNSYEAFSAFLSDPVAVLTTRQNIDYFIFPSNYVAAGGAVNCVPAFQSAFCAAAQLRLSAARLRELGLGCCADYVPSAEQAALLAQLRKAPVFEFPLPRPPIALIVVLVVVLAGLALGLVLLKIRKRAKLPAELVDYVRNALDAGYTKDEIRAALEQAGWKSEVVEAVWRKKGL